MSDLATVRAEIKGWERSFRATQGREPTVDDIKRLPDIANKYKLYKKLSKAALSNAPHATSSQSPTTPTKASRTRNGPLPSLAALHSRTAASTAPLSSFNPFSPQKAKGKERERTSQRIPQPLFNPFSSPSKPRPSSQATPPFESPDRPPSPPAPTSAISRARKRLRGEPVSPSPSKEKRRRTGSQTALNFPRLPFSSNQKPSTSFSLNTLESDEDDEDTAFVDDSPVKPVAGRAFNLFFDEAQTRPSADIFGLNSATTSKPSAPTAPLKSLNRAIFKAGQKRSRSRSSTPPPPTSEAPSSPRFNDTSADHTDADMGSEHASEGRSGSPLLPPSPPAGSQEKLPGKGKRKADSKAPTNKKKLKRVNNQHSDEEDTSDSLDLKSKVKIIDPLHSRKPLPDDLDAEDLILDLARSSSSIIPKHEEGAEKLAVEVNLPDKFKEILDLDATQWQVEEVAEDKLVKGLLYGRRVTTYDSKKGEIWDVGEEGDEDGGGQVDDEWEGEPVPWEAAEL